MAQGEEVDYLAQKDVIHMTDGAMLAEILDALGITCDKYSFNGKLKVLAAGLGIQAEGRLLGDVLNDIAAKEGIARDDRLYGTFIRKLYDCLTNGEDVTQSGNPLVLANALPRPLKECDVSWEPTQEGSGTPSPDNIRPISGRDAVKVERTGANYIDIKTLNKMTVSSCKYESTTETGFRITCMNPGSYKPCLFYLPARYILGKTITISFELVGKTSGAHPGVRVIGYADTYAQKTQLKELACNAIGTRYSCTASFPATIPDKLEGYAINFYATLAEADTGDYSEYGNVQIEIDTSASAYTPYTNQTTTLTLPRTVYGGEVDAQTGEGQETWKTTVLTGQEKIIDYRADENTDTYKGYAVYDVVPGVSSERIGICSHAKNGLATSQGYHPNEITVHYPTGNVYIRTEIPSVTSIDTFKVYLAAQYAAGTPVQIAYKLEQPVPFEATTGGAEIKALAGANTLMTDGDTITATYRCNVKAAEQEVNALYTDLLNEVEE